MLLKSLLVVAALGLAATSAGCAHETESVEEAARASCEEQHVAPGPAMDECMNEARQVIQDVRDRRNAPPRPEHHPQAPPSQPH